MKKYLILAAFLLLPLGSYAAYTADTGQYYCDNGNADSWAGRGLCHDSTEANCVWDFTSGAVNLTPADGGLAFYRDALAGFRVWQYTGQGSGNPYYIKISDTNPAAGGPGFSPVCSSGKYCFLVTSGSTDIATDFSNNLLIQPVFCANVVQATTTPTTTPPIINTGTGTLDAISGAVVNTSTSFLQSIFTNYWPFVLVFAIVSGFLGVIVRFFNKIIKPAKK